MAVYGVVLQYFMRLNGQLTPAELRSANFGASKFLFLSHNLISLLLVGSGTCYMLQVNLDKTVESETRTAVFVITSLYHIAATSTYFLLTVRLIAFCKSYDGIRRYLVVTKEFRCPPLDDRKYKFFIILFCTIVIAWRTSTAAADLVAAPKDVWYNLSSVASMVSHAQSILYAMKLALLSRHVKIHFLRANRLLSYGIKHLNHSKFCLVSKAEFDKLVKFHWESHDFLDKVNKAAGLEWFTLIFYMYVSILYRLYNATAYSSLFNRDDPDVVKAVRNLGQAVLNVMISLIVLSNGTTVAKEAENTLGMIWNAVPKIRCADCRRRLNAFAIQMSHLPVDMTARGVFTLNMKTFSNMISSAATQLVILISLGNQ